MNQFRSNFPVEFPLLSGIMSQWPKIVLVSLIPKLHVLLLKLGFIKRTCQVSTLRSPTNVIKLDIGVNEVNLVLTRLSLHCESEDPLVISVDEIKGLFEEEEPSFDEIKQAFDVFDRNRDGFIDALELCGVLTSLGLLRGGLASYNVEVCKMILSGFDHKGVGLVDIHDFVKLMEKCLASHH